MELEKKDRARLERYLAALELLGSNIRMPYSKNILPGIFELRVGGIQNIRLIFTFHNNTAVIFYGFKKKTEQIETHEMNAIKARFNDLHL